MELPTCLRALSAELQTIWKQAKARWPGLEVSYVEFAEHVAAKLSKDGTVVTSLASLYGDDLFLACACARGSNEAIRCFEEEYFGEVGRAFRKTSSLPVEQTDVEQMLREKLFTAAVEGLPKIAEYSGQGPLRVWLRVTVLRMLQNLATRGPREKLLSGEALADFPAIPGDPELDHIRARYRDEFREAFRDAFAALGTDDQTLLQQRFIKRLSQEELAVAYDVHVNTIARWLAKAKQTLEKQIRQLLSARLRLQTGEFTSVLRLVQSQLDLTLGAGAVDVEEK